MAEIGYTIKIQKTKNTAQMSGKELQSNNVAKDSNNQAESTESKLIATAMLNVGKQAIMTGINQYFQITGNTKAQEVMNNTISLGADALVIAKGGWVGAIAVAGKYAIQSVVNSVDVAYQNKQIEYNNQFLGFVSHSGSRYYE